MECALLRSNWLVVLALLLTAAVFGSQVVLLGDAPDDETLVRSAPEPSEIPDDVMRAQDLVSGEGFKAVFGDGRGMPGYPVFLSWFIGGFSQPLVAARFVQLFLAALAVPFAFLIFNLLLGSQRWALAGSLVFAAWVTFYCQASELTADPVCLFFYALFCYQMARPQTAYNRSHLLPMVVLAVLVYFKSAMALVVIPFALVIESRRGGGARGVTLLGPLAIVIVLVLPWSIWLSVRNGDVIPLTTSSGYRMYAGTGVMARPDTSAAAVPDLPSSSAESQGLFDGGMVAAVRRETAGLDAAARNRIYRRDALTVWVSRPLRTASYGVAKVFHSFGFSFRHARDTLTVLQLVVSVLFSIFLWRRKLHREWCVFVWGAVLVVALEAFVFLPEPRFRTLVFDFPALIVSVAGVAALMRGSTGASVPESQKN
jgi:hypothetical protein